MSENEPGSLSQQPRRLSVVIGVGIALAMTLVLVIAVGGVLFDLEQSDTTPPSVSWEFDPSDPPALTHGGGDPVECDRVLVRGDLGTGETLCSYFDSSVITEGDSATLMPIGNDRGTIVLAWEDPDTGQVSPIVEPFIIE